MSFFFQTVWNICFYFSCSENMKSRLYQRKGLLSKTFFVVGVPPPQFFCWSFSDSENSHVTGLELVEYGRYKKRLMERRYQFSNQCGPLQLMFLEALSNCYKYQRLLLSVVVACIHLELEDSTCFKHLNLFFLFAVMGADSWRRHWRFYTFGSLWIYSRLPYVLLRPRSSVEILWMGFTKKWRGL